jgi:hypothetical protein
MASVGRIGEIFLSRAAAVFGLGEFILRQLQQKSRFAQAAFAQLLVDEIF